jgi:glycolate oxidase FAD binding subunit
VILETSLKVLPKPSAELTLRFEVDEAEAILKMNQWAGLPLPLSASAWVGGALMLRLSGAETAVRAAHEKLGGEIHEHGADFWQAAKEQSAAFFSASDLPLWRLSVPAACPPFALPGRQALTWGGAQRWLKSDAAVNVVRSVVAVAGGHATLFRGGDKSAGAFHPLPDALMKYHRRLKAQFDPAGIFNPARFYPDF